MLDYVVSYIIDATYWSVANVTARRVTRATSVPSIPVKYFFLEANIAT